MKPLIAVSGKDGQLGWELARLSANFPGYDFVCCNRNELDITNTEQVNAFFAKYQPAVFINCAAYTAVDKAETDQATAFKVNAEAVGLLATQCQLHQTRFITFSTDYVFNGNGSTPYKENDAVEPVNYYGYTKLMGEQLAMNNCANTIIIRTSWVYSTHGHNFVKTMLRLMKEKPALNVVNDQVGSPTFAKDLAVAVMQLVTANNDEASAVKGIYHYSNEGVISWFDFAMAIKTLAGLNCEVHPIPTTQFPTPAKRPAYSVLDKQKITSEAGIVLQNWRESLAACIEALK